MALIPFLAKAGEAVMARIQAGDLEIVGLEVREADSKKIRYILRGAENLPNDLAQLGNLPPLQPLSAALSMVQLASIVSIAQNAMLARTLGRIEGKLDQMSQRLDSTFRRLGGMNFKLDLLVSENRAKPMNLLRAAQNAATLARRHGNTGQLIAAAKDAEQAARDLLSCAQALSDSKRDSVPAVLIVPTELAMLVEAAAEAMAIATAMQMALGSTDVAVRSLDHAASTIDTMRVHIAERVTDPALAEHRIKVPLAPDAAVLEAAKSIRHTRHWVRGRAALISAGLIGPGEDGELETTASTVGLAFEEVEPERAFLG